MPRPSRGIRLAGLALACFALAGGTALAANPQVGTLTMSYDLNLSGVPIAEMIVTVDLKQNSYKVRGLGQTVGLVDLVTRIRFSGTSSGRISDGVVEPKKHSYVYSERGKARTVSLTYGSDRIPVVTADPPFASASDRVPLPAEKLAGAIDVASQFVLPVPEGFGSLSRDNCERAYGISDGRVRIDATIHHAESVEKATVLRGTSYKGAFMHCTATVKAIGGHKIGGMLSKLEGDGVIDIWIAPVLGGLYYVPVKVSVPTSFGHAELVVRKLGAVPAPREAGLGG